MSGTQISSSTQVGSETDYYRKVTQAFDEYRRWSLTENNRRRKDFYRIPVSDQRLLPKYIEKLNEVDDRIRRNADVMDEIVFRAQEVGIGPSIINTSNDNLNEDQKDHTKTGYVSSIDASKVKSTLRQFVRDWSKLGEIERNACYKPMLIALENYVQRISPPVTDRSKIRVLVPGCGLGRLAWEVADRGFVSQGNESSYFMIMASNLVLNYASSVNQWSIFPFIHSFCNHTSTETLLSQVEFPDRLASPDFNTDHFGISMGDFCEIFLKAEEKDNWNIVLTCFFIDTAKNIVEYIRTIRHLLKPGGMWVNLGPTLWHYEGSSNPMDTSIELDVEEIKKLCQEMGFELDHDYDQTIETTYAGNPYLNLKQVYKANMWVAYKLEF
ncbi:hypothetical protein CROQUDRAFT_659304 [Cronartium quercuum f. sp. fusiforme G11]|uniref:carnosine N-methyltransferase n=1 Tax=Cronartium quercuum f. sp. fusiforme G11 TaxID=708437 RepID=A0A9P6NFA6_9BASI|nr:hypothetical protein CROQUDRAFT_659304 [Cronartium quercuum f. sp. fusiforme G11]